MCNDFGNRVPYDEYLRAFSQIGSGRPIRQLSSAAATMASNWFSCAGAFRQPSRRERRSSISAPKGGVSRWVAASCRRHISSSLPAPNRQRRSGSSPRPVRIGSASRVSGSMAADARWMGRSVHDPDHRARPGCRVDPQPSGRGARPHRLAPVARSDALGSGVATSTTGPAPSPLHR